MSPRRRRSGERSSLPLRESRDALDALRFDIPCGARSVLVGLQLLVQLSSNSRQNPVRRFLKRMHARIRRADWSPPQQEPGRFEPAHKPARLGIISNSAAVYGDTASRREAANLTKAQMRFCNRPVLPPSRSLSLKHWERVRFFLHGEWAFTEKGGAVACRLVRDP